MSRNAQPKELNFSFIADTENVWSAIFRVLEEIAERDERAERDNNIDIQFPELKVEK